MKKKHKKLKKKHVLTKTNKKKYKIQTFITKFLRCLTKINPIKCKMLVNNNPIINF